MEQWILTTAEVAKLLGVSRHSVKRYGRAGTLISKIVGSGQRLFSLSDVERFAKERLAKSARSRKQRGAVGRKTRLRKSARDKRAQPKGGFHVSSEDQKQNAKDA